MTKKPTYDNSSISVLEGADRVRKRPGVIFGSDGLEGCMHSFFEILSNSIDEAREGFGKVIEVTCFADHSIEVRDYGRGIPLEFNEKVGRYNWELVFCELYAGGKYDNNNGSNYEFSLGLNGLGACATQYSSEYMDVTVYRDGFKYQLHFEAGENIGGLMKEPFSGRQTGTLQRWKPDRQVFTDIQIPKEFFIETLKKQAVVNKGITFKFIYESVEGKDRMEFCYPEGIMDYMREMTEGSLLTEIKHIEATRRGRDRQDKPEYKLKIEAAFAFSNKMNQIEYYHNSSFLEHGGAPEKATRSAFVAAIDQYIRQSGKYNKNESKITYKDVEDSLVLVTNCYSTLTSYENQTKKAITNKFIQDAMAEFFKESLEVYFIENKADAESIANQVLVNKRSRENAEKTRQQIQKKLSQPTDLTNRIQKFVDCRTKDINRRELYIVEGDSALGSCKLARDAEFQAIIPVRGKILNCLKADPSKIFASEIIVDLIRILGCGVELKSKSNKEFNSFDLSLFRWNKIIICTDADVDGFQIRTLILAMLYTLTPGLIHAGKVFIAESPLFEITATKKGKTETFFAYTERDKAEILAKLDEEGKKYSIQRSKGLGENTKEMMSLTTMNPASRRLIEVLPDDAQKTAEVFELLLGDNLAGRKDHIAEFGGCYLDMLDVM